MRMGEHGDSSPHGGSSIRKLEYQSPLTARLVPLRRMRAMEAQLARVKLESEGIHCFVADQLMNVAHPLMFSEVELQVPEDQVQLATWILDAPPADAKPEEYVDEAWRCPACHRRKVDLLPLSPGWQIVKLLFIFTLLSPFAIVLAEWAFPIPAFVSWSEKMAPRFLLIWPIVSGVMALALLTRRRHKRCRDCGHVWIDNKPRERHDLDEDDSTDREPDDQ
jgi:rubredoxin